MTMTDPNNWPPTVPPNREVREGDPVPATPRFTERPNPQPKANPNSKVELTNLELRKQLKEAEGIISTLMASANTTRTLTKLTKVQAYQWLLAQATASEDS